MLIILEGADGTGKTTVATGLLDMLGDSRGFHASQPQGNWIDEYVNPLLDYTPSGDHANASPAHVVCDRWHWGELIYGPLYRGASIIDDDAFTYINAFLRSKGALIVHMWNTEDVIRKRWDERGEDFLQPEHLAQVLSQYHAIASASTVPVLNAREVRPSDLGRIMNVAQALEQAAVEMYGSAS